MLVSFDWFVLVLVLLVLSIKSDVVASAEDKGRMLPSDVQCVGSYLNCETSDSGTFTCTPVIEPVPPQSTICQLENVCIDLSDSKSDVDAKGTVIEIYDDSPQSKAWNGHGVSSSPFISNIGAGWEKEEGGIDSRLEFRVLPFDQMPKSEKFSSVPAVFMNRYVNDNVAHVWADEIWPIFQMLRRTEFFSQPYGNSIKISANTNAFLKHFQLVHSRTKEGYRTWEYNVVHSVVSGEHEPVALSSLRAEGQNKVCFKSLWAGSNGLSYSHHSPDPHELRAFRDFL